MPSILLIGNGPNYFSGDFSWRNVVRAAAKRMRMNNAVEQIIMEPLPLVYETIASRYPLQERHTKADLAKSMRALRPNDLHRQILALGWRTILTTNYDYCLEAAGSERFASANVKPESTYSLYRRRRSASRSIWHIHGEVSGPRTMMLGLHQYAGYLQKLRHYLTTKTAGSPFMAEGQAWASEDDPHSWADLFLRDDVHVIGFSFDYAETPLWWLLSYKQRLRHLKRLRIGSTTYYQLGKPASSDKRLRLMMALEVKVKPVPSRHKHPDEGDWERVLALLKEVEHS
jgi:hypothetical protein